MAEYPNHNNKQWSTGLLQVSSVAHYAMTAICPCQSIYHLYRKQERVRPNTREDPMLSCFLAALSACVVAPACMCADQFATRTIDGALLAQSVSSSRAGAPEYSPWSYFLTMIGYGDPPTEEHWASDRTGYDLQGDDSENWWPLRMCGVYTWGWLSAACSEGRAFGPHAPRLPLWMACCAGAAYPITLCPMAFMLRRIVADRSRIDEPYHETCLITACCLPCSLVQMEAEPPPQGATQMADYGGEVDDFA